MSPRTVSPDLTAQIEARAAKKTPPSARGHKLLIPSGCALFNLACSDQVDGFVPPGSVINVIGDKSAGKSLFCLTMAAEVANSKELGKSDLLYDDAESACKFPLEKMFGTKFLKRVTIPEDPSNTVEDFDRRFRNMLASGRSVIYWLDSYDSITSEEELKYLKKVDAASKSGKEAPGSYGQSKPKMASQFFRVCKREVSKTGSVLVVVSQVRENLDRPGPWSPKFKRSGGKALDHNADIVVWLTIVKRYKKRERLYGYRLEAKVEKNKVTGKRRSVQFDVFDQFGIDDVGSMVDFLMEEGWWKKTGNKIQTDPTMDLAPMDRADLLSAIESLGLESALKSATQKCWDQIEATLAINRKRRYE